MRFTLAAALCLLAVALTYASDEQMSEEEFEKTFNILIANKEDKAKAERKLKKAEERINKHNRENGDDFIEKITPDAILSQEEFEKEKTGLIMDEERTFGLIFDEEESAKIDEESEAYFAQMRSDYPDSYDARDDSLISPVKNQGACGSCAAFATGTVVETCIYMAAGLNSHVDLSEQYLLDCGYDGTSAKGCNGASPKAYVEALVATLNGEVTHENLDPYLGANPRLQCDETIELFNAGAKVTGKYHTYSCNTDLMKQLIYEHGAVLSALRATEDNFKFYSGGVITEACESDAIDHAIVLVGWGTDANGNEYWIGKNSWGPGWGEQGFFRIKMGICGVGKIAVVAKCTKGGPIDPIPAPPAKPKLQSCDISGIWAAYHPLTGNGFTLGITDSSGVSRSSKVNCDKSICEVLSSNPVDDAATDNACYRICGKTDKC